MPVSLVFLNSVLRYLLISVYLHSYDKQEPVLINNTDVIGKGQEIPEGSTPFHNVQ